MLDFPPSCLLKPPGFVLFPLTEASSRFELTNHQANEKFNHAKHHYGETLCPLSFNIIELDDGKILTGKPDQFDGKNPWLSG